MLPFSDLIATQVWQQLRWRGIVQWDISTWWDLFSPRRPTKHAIWHEALFMSVLTDIWVSYLLSPESYFPPPFRDNNLLYMCPVICATTHSFSECENPQSQEFAHLLCTKTLVMVAFPWSCTPRLQVVPSLCSHHEDAAEIKPHPVLKGSNDSHLHILCHQKIILSFEFYLDKCWCNASISWILAWSLCLEKKFN